jgi:cytochrome c peroxidase
MEQLSHARHSWSTLLSVSSIPLLVALLTINLCAYGHELSIRSTPNGLSATNSTPTEPVAKLGQKLFSDTRFSQDNSISCASCHQVDLAFTDGKARAEGIKGQTGTRNAPSLFNATYTKDKFWDGRRTSLIEQVLDPFTNPFEHGLGNQAELLERFKAAEDYQDVFIDAFNKELTQATVKDLAHALTAYVQFLKPNASRFDRYLTEQDKNALSTAEQQGLELFRGRAHCADCHLIDNTATLTDGNYHSRAIGLSGLTPRLASIVKSVAMMSRQDREHMITANPDIADLGRFVVTLHPADIGKFKTPSLREVAVTAPYMHDGSIATLEQAVNWELYYQSQSGSRPVVLSEAERTNLLAFLRALTSSRDKSTSLKSDE